jgi:hypothetical protein
MNASQSDTQGVPIKATGSPIWPEWKNVSAACCELPANNFPTRALPAMPLVGRIFQCDIV